ncbi:MAG: hypothetical protein JWO62_2319 [Acidimicrobiaceae bacterium]|jgi:hypothetical protein|nr:hypothetical protein [Acidimicrobiaceae bacterium]
MLAAGWNKWCTVNIARNVYEWSKKCLTAGLGSGYEALRYMAGIALDVYKRSGTIDPNRAFHPDEVDYFFEVTSRRKSPAWKKVGAAYLPRVGPHLAPKAPWPAKRFSVAAQPIK